MPKISNDWFNSSFSGQKREKQNSAEVFFRPEVGDEFVARIVGDYISFIAHWARQDNGEVDEKGQAVFNNVAFPDAEDRNYKPTRICTDDSPAKIRMKNLDGYLEKTKCPWCKLKYQGYKGTLRYAFNIIMRDDNGKKVCKIIEVPKSFMTILSTEINQIYQDEELRELVPEDGVGSVTQPTFILRIGRPEKNRWSVAIDYKKSKGIKLGNGICALDEEDIAALKAIHKDEENEEDYLKGHDLSHWFKKDYLSAEWQKEIFGKILELSDYDKQRQEERKDEEEAAEEDFDEPTPVENESPKGSKAPEFDDDEFNSLTSDKEEEKKEDDDEDDDDDSTALW